MLTFAACQMTYTLSRMNLAINQPMSNDLLRQRGIAVAIPVISKYDERPAIKSQFPVSDDLFRLDVGTFGRSHEIVGTLVPNQSKSLLTNVMVGEWTPYIWLGWLHNGRGVNLLHV